MTDYTLIYNYLDKQYRYNKITFNDNLEIVDNNGSYIIYLLYNIFSNIPDLINIVNNWKIDKIEELTKINSNLLKDCYLELGKSNWVVKHNTFGTIDTKNILAYLNVTKELRHLVDKCFDLWYEMKVIETSEKMMNLG